MISNVFMNGLQDDVFIMDEKVDPNLIQVMPDYMNNLSQRRYQQPQMVPDIAKNEGVSYECIPGEEWNPAKHPAGCQCAECRARREMDHIAIYQDLAFMQNCERKFVIDLNTYAFDTQSTKDYNLTTTMLRMYNSDSTPVLSTKYLVRLLYTLIAVDENGAVIKTEDGAIQSQAKRHFYMTTDQDMDGFWTYQFMDVHNTDVIVIPTMYGAQNISLNIRGIEVYGRTTGYSLTVENDKMIYVNTGVNDVLLFRDMFGVEYRGYAYPVEPHDRIRVNFSTVFNNISFIADITKLKDIKNGLDYRTCDFDTVPSWNQIALWTGTNITHNDFIPTLDAQSIQDMVDQKLSIIEIPNFEGVLKHAV